MLAAYVETAQQVSRLSEVDFFKRFGEAARVIRYLPGAATTMRGNIQLVPAPRRGGYASR